MEQFLEENHYVHGLGIGALVAFAIWPEGLTWKEALTVGAVVTAGSTAYMLVFGHKFFWDS